MPVREEARPPKRAGFRSWLPTPGLDPGDVGGEVGEVGLDVGRVGVGDARAEGFDVGLGGTLDSGDLAGGEVVVRHRDIKHHFARSVNTFVEGI